MPLRLPKLPAGAQWYLGDATQYGIVWAGRLCSPRWNEPGPAVAYALALSKATRRPEYEPPKRGPVWGARSLPERGRP